MSFGPPPAGFGPPAPSAWTPPTDIERALFEAKMRGDWLAYYDVLARVRLYYEVSREDVDADPERFGRILFRDPRTSAWRWELFTDGMLPEPRPDQVYAHASLSWIAHYRSERSPSSVVINPGSPCELDLPCGPPGSTEWSRVAERVGAPFVYRKRLRALHVGGPLHGPVARGLACGALLCVNNGSLWNAMAWHGTGYDQERKRLREWWGISRREQWQQHLRALLDCEASSSVWEFALGLRRALARDFGGHVDVEYWRHLAAQVLRANAAGSTVLGADGVTKTDPRPESETTARIEGVQRLIGRITRYEARMRADGILAENRYVTSVEAWDLGRASKMARWGLGARFGTVREAEAAVVEAGRKASLSYRSWQDFSAGYILGRCLHFDEEEFGDWYTDMADAHRILMSEPGSPWLNIPFR
ncbi:DUF1266 domain-containing protein [Streptomyces sp. NPDC012510]|uniref:DUF1266 domain-containing protein n=1 Tax=Streptomyces sp. NPDC012510 TaxID=3364838 RepID=UPI0036F10898